MWGPWVFCFGIAFWFSPTTEPSSWLAPIALLIVGLALLALYLKSASTLRLFFGLMMLAAFLCGVIIADIRSTSRGAPVLPTGAGSWLTTGLVSHIDRETKSRARYLIAVTKIENLEEEKTPKYVRVGGPIGEARIGSLVEFRAQLEPPSQASVPGGFSFARMAWFRQIGGSGFTFGHLRVLEQPIGLNAPLRISKVRYDLAKTIRQRMPGQSGAIASALITGDRSAIDQSVTKAFREAGLGHLLAISGLHMSIVGGLVFWLASLIFVAIPAIGARYDARKPAALAGLAASFGYLIISGAAAPAQRAFIMLGLIFIAVLLGRRALSIRTISIAAFFVAILTPEYVVNPGFQMSFAASLALIACYQYAGPWFSRQRNMNSSGSVVWALSHRIWLFFLAITLTSLIAGSATAPFASWHFHKFASYSLLGNLLAMPVFTTFVMPSLITGLVFLPIGLEGPFFQVSSFGLDLIQKVSAITAGLPGATIGVPSAPGLSLALQAGALLVVCIASWRVKLLALPMLIIAIYLQIQSPQPVLWVGKSGGAILIKEHKTSQFILFGKPNKFGLRQFAQTAGIPNFQSIDITKYKPANCDRIGCEIYVGKKRIIIQNSTEDIATACHYGDMVIAPGYLLSRQQPFCSSTHVLHYSSDNGTVFYGSGNDWNSTRMKSDRLWDRKRYKFQRN